MGFFDVKDGEGGSPQDRIAIIAIMVFAFSWIPVMTIWKCISVLHRRNRDPNEGNLPVTTHASDPERHPYHPEMASHPRQEQEDDDSSRHKRDRSHESRGNQRHNQATSARSSFSDLPRRPEPLAGSSHYRPVGDPIRPQRSDRPYDSSEALLMKRHGESPLRSNSRRADCENYPGDPLRMQSRSRSRSRMRSGSRSDTYQQDFESVVI